MSGYYYQDGSEIPATYQPGYVAPQYAFGGGYTEEKPPTPEEVQAAYLDKTFGLTEESQVAQLELSQQAQDIANAQEARAEQMWGVYTDVYLPNEIKFAEASFAGIPVDQQLAWASNDVAKAYNDAWNSQQRDMTRLGVDPSDPLYAKQKQEFDMAKAAADAGARNVARMNVNNQNYTRQAAAVGLGKETSANSAGFSTGAVNSLGAASTMTGAAYTPAIQAYQYGTQVANQQAVNSLTQQQIKQQEDAAMWGAISSFAGAGAQAYGYSKAK